MRKQYPYGSPLVRSSVVEGFGSFVSAGGMKHDEKLSSLTGARILKAFLLCIPVSALLLFLCLTLDRPSPVHEKSPSADLQIRRNYQSYDEYVNGQLKKTLDPKLRKIWTTRDWRRKVVVFSRFFTKIREEGLLRNESRCLSIGARVGQEVQALREIGVNDSIGIDLVPYPPLVVKGDFHNHPFRDDSFDFEFSNVFDHALYPDRFVSEIERTLMPGGICVLHVLIKTKGDKYSANDLDGLVTCSEIWNLQKTGEGKRMWRKQRSAEKECETIRKSGRRIFQEQADSLLLGTSFIYVAPLIDLFKHSDVVHVRPIDGFGLDHEIVFRKKKKRRNRLLPPERSWDVPSHSIVEIAEEFLSQNQYMSG